MLCLIMSNTNIATKQEAIKAGKEMSSLSTPAQQANHAKVIAWIETLAEVEVPSTTNATTTYKMLIQKWAKLQGIK